jgi:CDP-diacylglycerol--serine O-phosphatidyltransferase
MIRHFLNPPNWFTSAGIFCGMYSIVLATGVEGEPNFYKAAMMVLFASVFDMLDGRVARITGRGSDFGVQLDSLADMVSFGIAPAVLLYAWGIHSLGVWGLVGAFAFVLCGAFRLARFNCQADVGDKPAFSEGLTITMAGGMVAASVMAHAASGRMGVEHPWNVWALALILGLLMVSSVPYRTPSSLKLSRGTRILSALFWAAILLVAVRYRASTAFVLLLGSYVVSGPLEAIIRRKRVTLIDDADLGLDGWISDDANEPSDHR